jgi:hypothetical protein
MQSLTSHTCLRELTRRKRPSCATEVIAAGNVGFCAGAVREPEGILVLGALFRGKLASYDQPPRRQ